MGRISHCQGITSRIEVCICIIWNWRHSKNGNFKITTYGGLQIESGKLFIRSLRQGSATQKSKISEFRHLSSAFVSPSKNNNIAPTQPTSSIPSTRSIQQSLLYTTITTSPTKLQTSPQPPPTHHVPPSSVRPPQPPNAPL